jgi:hypothetical protein
VASGDADFDGDIQMAFRGQANGLLGAAVPGVLVLTTALHTGEVGFRVVVHDCEPPPDDSWEEVVEASFQAGTGQTVVRDWNGVTVCAVPLAAGSHRVRFAGSRMDEASEADTLLDGVDPIDSYELTFWPSPVHADEVIKQTSAIAEYWHDARAT